MNVGIALKSTDEIVSPSHGACPWFICRLNVTPALQLLRFRDCNLSIAPTSAGISRLYVVNGPRTVSKNLQHCRAWFHCDDRIVRHRPSAKGSQFGVLRNAVLGSVCSKRPLGRSPRWSNPEAHCQRQGGLLEAHAGERLRPIKYEPNSSRQRLLLKPDFTLIVTHMNLWAHNAGSLVQRPQQRVARRRQLPTMAPMDGLNVFLGVRLQFGQRIRVVSDRT